MPSSNEKNDPHIDWSRFDKKKRDQINAEAADEKAKPGLTGRRKRVVAHINGNQYEIQTPDVRAIRENLKLTQASFATGLGERWTDKAEHPVVMRDGRNVAEDLLLNNVVDNEADECGWWYASYDQMLNARGIEKSGSKKKRRTKKREGRAVIGSAYTAGHRGDDRLRSTRLRTPRGGCISSFDLARRCVGLETRRHPSART